MNGGESERVVVDRLAVLLTEVQTAWQQARTHRSDYAGLETRLVCWTSLAARLHQAELRARELARRHTAELATPVEVNRPRRLDRRVRPHS